MLQLVKNTIPLYIVGEDSLINFVLASVIKNCSGEFQVGSLPHYFYNLDAPFSLYCWELLTFSKSIFNVKLPFTVFHLKLIYFIT
jgi:hypothetical protein